MQADSFQPGTDAVDRHLPTRCSDHLLYPHNMYCVCSLCTFDCLLFVCIHKPILGSGARVVWKVFRSGCRRGARQESRLTTHVSGTRHTYQLQPAAVRCDMVLHRVFRARHVRKTGIGGEVRHGVASGVSLEASFNIHVTSHSTLHARCSREGACKSLTQTRYRYWQRVVDSCYSPHLNMR